MSTDTAGVISRARMLSSLSQRQLAIMADLSPSTVSRVERGELDPTVSVFGRMLAACGFEFGQHLSPVTDMDAVRAARVLLDPESGIALTAPAQRWVDRWQAAGLVTRAGTVRSADGLAFRAGTLARLANRPGSRRFAATDWKSVARALRGAGQDWALTGGFAALRYTQIASATWPVFYVRDVDKTAARAGLTREAAGAGVTLMEMDELTATGIVETANGARWADKWQVAIDCYAGTGRMPDQAESMIATLTAAQAVAS